MKKRAVLFLLVLCTVLCLALPAMATKYISTSTSDENKKNRYNEANTSGEDIEMNAGMAGVDMTTGIWPLNTTMELAGNIIFEPQGLTIQANGVLRAKDGFFPRIDCDITNYGTIESGTYTGTITNYGIITGGTFTGTVINATENKADGSTVSGTVRGGIFNGATLKVRNAAGVESDGANDRSFDDAYITVTLKLNADEHITGTPVLTQKILRGSGIWTEKPTRDGDPANTSTVFAYWRKEGSTGTDDIYAHDYFNAPGSQITVTPVWCDHLVQFDVNAAAGSVLLNDRMLPMAFYKNEGKALSPNAFVWVNVDKNGIMAPEKAFLCWNTRADGRGLNYPGEENKLNFTPDFNSGKTETTLYTRWVESRETASRHTIIYRRDAEGSQEAEAENIEISKATGSHTLKQNMFTPERGQVFIGWKVQGIEHPALLQPGQTILIVQQDAAQNTQTTITAQWQKLPVTEITFDANGTGVTGTTGTGGKETYYLNETPNLPANSFTRAGYTFTGWNTKADGTGTGYTDGQQISITGELAGDGTTAKEVTLYAQWKSNAEPATPTPPPATPLPPTGDDFNLTLWLGLCIASAAALIVMKKRRFSQR